MNPAHAALVANAVRLHRFVDVEIRLHDRDVWRGVRGEEVSGSQVQHLQGYATQLLDDADHVHLMVEDFPGGRTAWPDAGWQVRFGGDRIRRIAGPAQVVDTARLFLMAPLVSPA